jgi:hypothetical protein
VTVPPGRQIRRKPIDEGALVEARTTAALGPIPVLHPQGDGHRRRPEHRDHREELHVRGVELHALLVLVQLLLLTAPVRFDDPWMLLKQKRRQEGSPIAGDPMEATTWPEK